MPDTLKRVLAEWSVPAPSAAFDERVMAAYRRQTGRWWRWFTLPVPLPVAAVLLIALLASAVWMLRTSPPAAISASDMLLSATAQKWPGGTGYITAANLKGFEPVEKVSLRVKGESDAR